MLTITELLDEQGVDYKTNVQHTNVREGWLGVKCPFCRDVVGKYHMGINLDSGHCSCWVCGWHSLANVLVELTGEPYFSCVQWADIISAQTIREELPKRGRLKVPKGVTHLGWHHRRYLLDRGFKPNQLVHAWNIRGIDNSPGKSHSIYIPITYRGEVVSWTTRRLSDKSPRYITAKPEEQTMSPNDFLFGECHCLHMIVVVEGPFDMFRIGYGAATTMGLGLSQKQFLRVAKYPTRILCFDNEPMAQARAKELCKELSGFPGETLNLCLDAPDPGSATSEEISDLRKRYLR